MDIVINKKKRPLSKWVFLIVLVIAASSFAVKYLWLLGQADFSVDRDKLVFGEVKQGTFTVSVRGNGVLMPDHIQWLSAGVDAKVEKLVVKAGNSVKTGDLIVELSNPRLHQQLAEMQWEMEAKEAEAIASDVAQEETLLAQEAKVLSAKLDYESSLLKYNAQTELLTKTMGTVSKLAYEQTRLTTDQLRQRWRMSVLLIHLYSL